MSPTACFCFRLGVLGSRVACMCTATSSGRKASSKRGTGGAHRPDGFSWFSAYFSPLAESGVCNADLNGRTSSLCSTDCSSSARQTPVRFDSPAPSLGGRSSGSVGGGRRAAASSSPRTSDVAQPGGGGKKSSPVKSVVDLLVGWLAGDGEEQVGLLKKRL